MTLFKGFFSLIGQKQSSWGLRQNLYSPGANLTQSDFCKIIRKFQSHSPVFRNPHYARSFFSLFAAAERTLGELLPMHLLKSGVDILLKGTAQQKKALVFDWLDTDCDGFISRLDLERGLSVMKKILRKGVGHWLHQILPAELLIDEGDTMEIARFLQNEIPERCFVQFLDKILTEEEGLMSKQDFVFSPEDHYEDASPSRRDFLKEEVVLHPLSKEKLQAIWFLTSVRLGENLLNLKTPRSAATFVAVSPVPLSLDNVSLLERKLFSHDVRLDGEEDGMILGSYSKAFFRVQNLVIKARGARL